MDAENFDLQYKILIIGDTEVGKTSTILRYTENKFKEEGLSTIGVDLKYKYVTIENKKIRIALWDTAGQEKFRCLTKNYLRGADGIILLFDLTRKESFIRLKNWLADIDDLSENSKIIIVGNKCENANSRQVTEQLLKDFGKKMGIETFEASAKTGEGVNEFFGYLINKLFEDKTIGKIEEDDEDDAKKNKKRGQTLSSKGGKNKHNCKC